MVIVVYYNPQSILVSFPIAKYTDVFRSQVSSLSCFQLAGGQCYIAISCVIGTCDLPDMYALSPQTCCPQALGIHIRQITCSLCYN